MSDIQEEIKEYTEFYGGKDKIMNLLLNKLEKGTFSDFDDEFQKCCYYYITNLQEEYKKLKDLCDKYEEEHITTFIEWQKDIKANKKAIEEINKRSSKEVAKLYIDILKGDNK